jgi:hypothetical protein
MNIIDKTTTWVTTKMPSAATSDVVQDSTLDPRPAHGLNLTVAYYQMRHPMLRAMPSLKLLLLAGSLAVLGSPAGADSLKFYLGTGGYDGPSFTKQAGSVYALTQGNATNCPTLGTCLTDNISPTLTYLVGGITITASATYNGSANSVWGDFAPSFGGLGVGTNLGNSAHNLDDQLNGYEALKIHFSTGVTLTGIGTLFDSGHTPFGASFPIGSDVLSTNTFLFSTNGTTYNPLTFGAANDGPFTSTKSQDFYFMEAGCAGTAGSETCSQPEFYVSALTYSVPGPLAGAGLPGLVAACGGLLAWWRRRQNEVAPVV